MEIFMNQKKAGSQKHMEVVSLSVLVTLRQKNDELCMKAIMELPPHQIDYIRQIADEYDEEFSMAMQAAIETAMAMTNSPTIKGGIQN